MEEQEKLTKEQALLKASMDKTKLLKTKEEMMNWIAEEKQIAEKYREKIAGIKYEETEGEFFDYWKVD